MTDFLCTVPLRNTTLPHLRDGFSRALVARMKLPHVAESMDEAQSEVSSTAASSSSLFPFAPSLYCLPSLARHGSLELTYSPSQAAAASLTELKGFFPGRTLPKGSPLELYYSSSKRTVLFQTKVSLWSRLGARSR